MPSHRADTPADAPTIVPTRPTASSPHQRRRELRRAGDDGGAGAATAGGPGRPVAAGALTPRAARTDAAYPSRRQVHAFARTAHGSGRGGTALLERETTPDHPVTWGAVALDPLFVTRSGRQPADGWVVAEPLGGQRSTRRPPARPPVPRRSSPGETPQDVDPPAPWPASGPMRHVAAVPAPSLHSVRRACDVAGAPDVTRVTPTHGGRVRAVRRETAVPTASAGRRPGLSLPQVGIVGALGLATIAVPLTGAFGVAPPAKGDSGTVTAVAGALAPLPPFPLASRPPVTALDDARLLPDEEPAASIPARLAAPHILLVGGSVSRSNERSVLPGCNDQTPDVGGVLNGQLPASMLCTLWDPRRQLRSDAAVAIAKLNIAYQQQFGHPMCFNDAYRSLAQQIKVKAERGGFAARPGTSEHGWGLAVDLCDGVDGGPSSPTYQWMRENAPFYGWDNPAWAQAGGAGPYEPWHWEFFPGEKDTSPGD